MLVNKIINSDSSKLWDVIFEIYRANFDKDECKAKIKEIINKSEIKAQADKIRKVFDSEIWKNRVMTGDSTSILLALARSKFIAFITESF